MRDRDEKSGNASPQRQLPPGEAFIGREREIALLEEALDAACNRRGSVVVLVGEAGIGKTRTSAELAARARTRRVEVLTARCFEGESLPPYDLWRTALHSLPDPDGASSLSALSSADLHLLTGDEARARLFESVIGALRAAARERPILALLDNLQWADPGSLMLLEHLGAEIDGMSLMVLGTYRDTDLDDGHPLRRVLAELLKGSGYRRIGLSGLSPREAGLYIERALGAAQSDELVREIHRRTDGNPLFLLELVRAMWEGPTRGTDVPRIPPGVKDVIGARLARLPAECLPILSTASVMGRVFTTAVLQRVREETPADRIMEALERARDAGFVQEMPGEPGEYRFTHVLVQETLYDRLSSAQKARAHARIASVMEGLAGAEVGAWAGVISRHLAEAADPLSLERLLPMAMKAADHAQASLAPDQAVAYVDLALRAKAGRGSVAADGGTAELLYRRACLLNDMARSKEAEESLHSAFDAFSAIGNTERMVDVALTPVQGVLKAGSAMTWSYADTGLRALRERALSIVPPDTLMHGRLLAHQPSVNDIRQALHIARREGDAALEMTALWHLAFLHLCAGEVRSARAEEEEAWKIARRIGDGWTARFLLYRRCQSSCLVGDRAGLEECGREMLAEAELMHSRLSLAAAHQANAIIAHLAGDWDGCRGHARECIRLQTGQGGNHSRMVSVATLALTEGETGNNAAADALLESCGAAGGTADTVPFFLPKLAWITGDARYADAAETALGPLTITGPAFEWTAMSSTFAHALLAVMRADRAKAARFLDHYLPWKGLYMPWNASGMPTDALIALLLATLGRYDEAMDRFEEARAFCRRAGCLPELARTCRDHGEALLRRGAPGDAARAAEILREGLAAAERLSMAPAAERIRAALERAEAARGAAEDRPAGLSEREEEVLRWVARGCTNAEIGERLFISPHTVARHVQNILEKTGMANRTELASFAFRSGLMEE